MNASVLIFMQIAGTGWLTLTNATTSDPDNDTMEGTVMWSKNGADYDKEAEVCFVTSDNGESPQILPCGRYTVEDPIEEDSNEEGSSNDAFDESSGSQPCFGQWTFGVVMSYVWLV